MHEKLEIEQYFFDEPTLDHLARFAGRFDNPCCLCTPSLGQELERRGIRARTLDLDGRFSLLQGFRLYDISRPEPLDEQFGIIICDPPFWSVSLGQLLETVKVLSHGDYSQPVIVNYLVSRAPIITSVFAAFGLQPTGYRPGYLTTQNVGRNQMEFYGNMGPEHPLRLPATVI